MTRHQKIDNTPAPIPLARTDLYAVVGDRFMGRSLQPVVAMAMNDGRWSLVTPSWNYAEESDLRRAHPAEILVLPTREDVEETVRRLEREDRTFWAEAGRMVDLIRESGTSGIPFRVLEDYAKKNGTSLYTLEANHTVSVFGGRFYAASNLPAGTDWRGKCFMTHGVIDRVRQGVQEREKNARQAARKEASR